MSVKDLVNAAFALARKNNSGNMREWIGISYRIGRLLPNSLLTISLQRAGEIDCLLRSMEDELVKLHHSDAESNALHTHYQMLLSEYWIGAIYECVRLLQECELMTGDEFEKIAHELRMLRIPLEKHQIAADKKLKDPLPMQRIPDDKIYLYDPNDKLRSHVMPILITKQGSQAWYVIDPIAQRSYWLERRDISDRIKSLWTRKD